MRSAFLSILTAGVLALGCQKESSQGGPGATKDAQTDSTNVFTVKVPKTAVKVKQGQEEKVAISINRGKAFDQTIKLTFDLPKGVEVTPSDAEVKQGQTQREFSFKANKDAGLGAHAVKVTGTPESGPATSVSFSVHVVEDEASKERSKKL